MKLPTSKTPPKSSLSDVSILLYGPSKTGKCLGGETLLYDPLNGSPQTIAEMVEAEKGNVHSLTLGGKFAIRKPSAFLKNEEDQLYRLVTQTGYEIESTGNHPFLTREGWKPLAELKLTDRVAVSAQLDVENPICKTDEELLKILAYLIADGNLQSSPTFAKSDPEVRMDFENAVEAKGDECVEFTNDKGVVHVRVRGAVGRRNNVINFLKQQGIHGLRSGEKFLPDFVFRLPREKLALLLNRLFTCDGSVEITGRISYSSKSIRLVRQVKHLLLRFGIIGNIRDRFINGELYGAELMICAKPDVLAFLDEIGFIGEKQVRAEQIRLNLYSVRAQATQLDRNGSILFDRVVKIEPTRVAPVYDLTVPDTHNFLANDFVVHNSTWASHAPDAVFLATEPGLNALEVYQVPITSWPEFLEACAELAKGEHPFKTVVIDTLDVLYRLCADHICQKRGIEHESDGSHGKVYGLIKGELYRVITKLAHLPYGLILISHSQDRDLETRTGTVTRTVPTLTESFRQVIIGMVDLILYCDVEMVQDDDGRKVCRRVIRTKPSPNYDAGDRFGRLPDVMPLNFPAFAEAFEKRNESAAPAGAGQQNPVPAAKPAKTGK